jgi:hypothetical protein
MSFTKDNNIPKALMIERIVEQMRNVSKPPRKFIAVLLVLLSSLRDRANFRNMSRYSDYHENTFSRWFRRDFDLVELNRLGLKMTFEPETWLIGAMDGCFIPKSGKHTEGLSQFYNGVRARRMR